ncbi:MAG: hypothetical protein D3910_03650 [Candidatus Electrothrix sp. ATG2]|nr:hypothetical protein [Candidatus Electrothrix sp. ATG2]
MREWIIILKPFEQWSETPFRFSLFTLMTALYFTFDACNTKYDKLLQLGISFVIVKRTSKVYQVIIPKNPIPKRLDT